MFIRLQAENFLNAYKVLSENNKACFDDSVGKPNNFESFGKLPTPVTDIVCLSFAMELYLKELHYVVNKSKVRGHKILDLFKTLPEDVRSEIFSCEVLSQNPFFTSGDIFKLDRYDEKFTAYDGFIQQLEKISNAFVEWRYAHENGTLKFNAALALGFVEAVKSVSEKYLSKAD